MSKMSLTIQHNDNVFTPPIEDGVTIEWERTGSPGKLKFTIVKSPNGGMSFQEGDPVCFYYDDKPVFVGFVFKKQRDRKNHIEVTCYDQIRYLKNKYTYVFEKKTATQIIKSLCNDFKLNIGTMDNTSYVIPAIAEENKSALDISLDVLEETLTNTGKLYVLYDDCGKMVLKNSANMVSTTLIMEDTAENFDYTSSIDDETYNNVVLYYKTDDDQVQIYTASSPTTIAKWGTLRYFEEVDTPTSGENKAKALLKLYNKKSRELKVTGAFGDISVRGGTLIPVKLNLGDVVANNYMLVDKVTHTFECDKHTMDLTLAGYWYDGEYEVTSSTIGEIIKKPVTTSNNYSNTNVDTSSKPVEYPSPSSSVTITCNGLWNYAGQLSVTYQVFNPEFIFGEPMYITKYEQISMPELFRNKSKSFTIANGTNFNLHMTPMKGHEVEISPVIGDWGIKMPVYRTIGQKGSNSKDKEYETTILKARGIYNIIVKWVE